MMRGPSYDDSYLSRRMGSLAIAPPLSYGRTPSYLQLLHMINENEYDHAMNRRSLVHSSDSDHFFNPFKSEDDLAEYGMMVPRGYLPPARLPPRGMPPQGYGDYDYGGYGGYYGAPAPYYAPHYPYGGYAPAPRLSRFDHYLDDDYEATYPALRGTRSSEVEKDKTEQQREEGGAPPKSRFRAIEAPPSSSQKTPIITEGDRHLARMQLRYPSLSEPQMLQDQVDKMRIRLKALAYSLDPSGPVPEIVVPPRSKKASEDIDYCKKYSSAFEMNELPRLSTRRHHVYPEDQHMKDNLGIKCLSHYKDTRTQAGPTNEPPETAARGYGSYSHGASVYRTPALPDYTSKYSSRSLAKWEEPDTVYGPTSDKKPYSKDSVRFSSSSKKADGDEDDTKKEKRKKKKSRERDELSTTEVSADATAAEAPAAEPAPATEGDGEDGELDEKEKKRLEKKKRKAEREAAAKAAMEAELEALAEAEAELARLEAAESGAAPAEVKAEEVAAEKYFEQITKSETNLEGEDAEAAWLAVAEDAATTSQDVELVEAPTGENPEPTEE